MAGTRRPRSTNLKEIVVKKAFSLMLLAIVPVAGFCATPAQEKAFVDAYRKAYEAKDEKTLTGFLYTKGADPQALDFYKMMMTNGMGSKITSIQLAETGPDSVRVSGVRGRPRTDSLKVSIAYTDGWKSTGTLVYGWPNAVAKASTADRILRERLDRAGLRLDAIHTEFVGWNSTHGALTGHAAEEVPEVTLRISVRGQDREAADAFGKQVQAMVLSGPPGVTGFGGGRPKAQEVVAYWPALIDRRQVEPFLRLEVAEA